MPSILIFAHDFGRSPEVGALRMNALAAHLGAQGWTVDVISGPDSSPLADSPGNISTHCVAVGHSRIVSGIWRGLIRMARHFRSRPPERSSTERPEGSPAPTSGAWSPARGLKGNVLGLLFSVDGRKRWIIKSVFLALRLSASRKYDLVLATTPPAAAAVGASIVARLRGIRFVLDLRDPWDSNSRYQTDSALPRWLDRSLRRRVFPVASLVTCASPGVGRVTVEDLPDVARKLEVILNGFDQKDVSQSQPRLGRLSMLFAGALYLQRNPFPLLESLARLLRQPGVRRDCVSMVFIGDCGAWNGVDLRDWCEQHELGDIVSVLPPVPRDQLGTYRDSATVLVNLAQGQVNQIPAKTYEIVASGRDALIVTEKTSDTALLLAGLNGCFVVDDRDEESLFQALKALYERNAGNAGDALLRSPADIERFSRDQQNAKWQQLLAQQCAEGRSLRVPGPGTASR